MLIDSSCQAIHAKPFLKWAGGKAQLASVIGRSLGDGKRLVEPFVGSGAIFMGTHYARYLLCDKNADLIGLFNNLKRHPKPLMVAIAGLFVAKFNEEKAFYALRQEFNALDASSLRKSALFVYLNKHAFNGLCRYNKKGGFNVPYGRYRAPSMPTKELQLFARKAQIAEFKCLDFVDAFKLVEDDDLVYCDPPYMPLSSTAHFTAYAAGDFHEKEQRELARQIQQAKRKGAKVVVSNHDIALMREIYDGAAVISLEVRRSISRKASTRGMVKELVATFE